MCYAFALFIPKKLFFVHSKPKISTPIFVEPAHAQTHLIMSKYFVRPFTNFRELLIIEVVFFDTIPPRFLSKVDFHYL